MSEQPRNRNVYMRTEGFALAADVGHQFMEEVAAHPLPPVPLYAEVKHAFRLPGTAGALQLVTAHVSAASEMVGWQLRNDWSKYGVTSEDIDPERNMFLYNTGLEEMHFTFPFSSAVASKMVCDMVDKGLMSPKAFDNMSLLDWADMIRKPWFRTTMHELARGKNGQYGNFGISVLDYYVNALGYRFSQKGVHVYDVFTYNKGFDEDGYEEIQAAPSKALKAELLRNLREAGDTGCPVANHEGVMKAELANANPHMQRMIAAGHLAVARKFTHRGEEYVRYVQAETPIDVGLTALAGQLERYSKRFGRPVSLDGDRIRHTAEERTYPLRTGVRKPPESSSQVAQPGRSATTYVVSLEASLEDPRITE